MPSNDELDRTRQTRRSPGFVHVLVCFGGIWTKSGQTKATLTKFGRISATFGSNVATCRPDSGQMFIRALSAIGNPTSVQGGQVSVQVKGSLVFLSSRRPGPSLKKIDDVGLDPTGQPLGERGNPKTPGFFTSFPGSGDAPSVAGASLQRYDCRRSHSTL